MSMVRYVNPLLTAVYSAGGLYVARSLKGSSEVISLTALGTAAAIGGASALVAKPVTGRLVCPHSPGAVLIEAATSSAVAWAAVWAIDDMESANMFVPVQFGSQLLAGVVAPYIQLWMVQKDLNATGVVDDKAMTGSDGMMQ